MTKRLLHAIGTYVHTTVDWRIAVHEHGVKSPEAEAAFRESQRAAMDLEHITDTLMDLEHITDTLIKPETGTASVYPVRLERG